MARATERTLGLLVEDEFNIRVLTLESGFDPDLFIRRKGKDAYSAALKNSQKYFDYLIDRARAQCGGEADVVTGGATHRETMLAAFRAGSAPLVLIHDVAHPFVTPALAREVIEAARGRGAAVAAVVATSSAYRRAPGTTPVRLAAAGEIWLVRRPFVFRRADFTRGLATAGGDEGLSVILARVGVSTELVPAPSWNIKVSTADDWAVAQALCGQALQS